MSIHNIDSTSPPVIEAVIVPTVPSEATFGGAAVAARPSEPAAPAKKSWPKVIGKEFLNFILLCIVAKIWVPRFVSPIASLITGERDVSPGWSVAAILAVLLCYGFCVGKSDPSKRVTRILLQIFLTVGSGVLGIALASKVSAARMFYVVSAGIVLGAGALVGSRFSSDDETPAKKPEKKSNPILTVVTSVLGIAIGLGLLFGSQLIGTAAQKSIYVSKTAPATIFETTDGEPWTFADHRGKVVLVEFWAPYCGPCVASFPAQRKTYEEFSQHEDFKMVSVSVGNQKRSIKTFEAKKAEWELVFSPEERGPNDLRPYGIPAAYIIDRDGKVVAAQLRGKTVDAELRKLLPSS